MSETEERFVTYVVMRCPECSEKLYLRLHCHNYGRSQQPINCYYCKKDFAWQDGKYNDL